MDTVTIVAISVLVLVICTFYLGMFWQRVENRRSGQFPPRRPKTPPEELNKEVDGVLTVREMIRRTLKQDPVLRYKILSKAYWHINNPEIHLEWTHRSTAPLNVVRDVLLEMTEEEQAILKAETND